MLGSHAIRNDSPLLSLSPGVAHFRSDHLCDEPSYKIISCPPLPPQPCQIALYQLVCRVDSRAVHLTPFLFDEGLTPSISDEGPQFIKRPSSPHLPPKPCHISHRPLMYVNIRNVGAFFIVSNLREAAIVRKTDTGSMFVW
jgi:hypothetical protein